MKSTLAIGCLLTVLLPGIGSAQSGTLLPLSSVDLPGSRTFFIKGTNHHITDGGSSRDFVVAESSSSEKTEAGSSNSSNYAYDIPVYSPVDGEIITCWSNYPDRPDSDDSKVSAAGNHVSILTPDNRVVMLGHLRSESVLKGLCQHSNRGTYPTDLSDRDGAWAKEYIVYNNRKTVKKGQRVGSIGNSGKTTSNPHVHHQETPYLGSFQQGGTEPLRYINGWVKYSGQDWKKLDAEAINTAPVWIHASPFLRRDTDTGGTFAEVSMAGSVAALSNSSGNLQIIVYLVNAQGALTRGGVAEAGSATNIKLVHPDPGSANAVTALRSASGNLKLIAWQISESGQITRRGDADAGPVKAIALTPFPDRKGVVTATRGNQDDFKLVAWEVTPSLSLVRRGDIGAGKVQHMDATTTHAAFSGIVSATTGSDNTLKLIAWGFDPASKTFTRRGDASAGAIQGELRIVRAPLGGRDLVVTGMRSNDGNLRLIAWDVSAGGQIVRKGTASAGAVSLVDLAVGRGGHVIATVRTGGNLRMIAFKVHANGEIERVGTDGAGAISRITSSYINRSGRDFLLTAVRDGENKLRVISWEVNLK